MFYDFSRAVFDILFRIHTIPKEEIPKHSVYYKGSAARKRLQEAGLISRKEELRTNGWHKVEPALGTFWVHVEKCPLSVKRIHMLLGTKEE